MLKVTSTRRLLANRIVLRFLSDLCRSSGVTSGLFSIAVLIAAFQWGDWMHPIIVTAIFIVIQNLEGMFYAPRIVGNSVGLHPMTVIVSIFVWGLLIGGLLGPILAVPLTATIKVLLTRYVWGPRMRERVRAQVDNIPVVRESHGEA